MPPRKLKNVIRLEDGLQLGIGYVLGQRPEFATLIMQVIENTSRTAARVERMLAHFLKVEVHVAMKMLQSIESKGPKSAVIHAAAEHVLSPQDFELFRATLQFARASERRRDWFAHRIWATSTQVPDGLVLIDPRHMNDYEARLAEHNRNRPKGLQFMPPGAPLWGDAYVFTVADLEEDVRESFHVDQTVGRLEMLLADPAAPEADERRRELLAEPRIASKVESQLGEIDQ